MSMTSMQRYQKMLSLKPYQSRDEMPVFPMMLATFGALGGVSQKDICTSADKWIEAIDNTIKKVGKPDVCMPICPGDTIFAMGLPSRLPGRELDDNALYQFVEKPYFEPDEYAVIYQMGWNAWYGKYLMEIQKPPLTDPAQLGGRYAQLGQNAAKTIGYIFSQGMVPDFDTATAPIFDSLSMIRSMADFVCDMYDDPGPIMDIIRRDQPILDEQTIQMCLANHGTRVASFAMRSSCTFISPDMFEEYVWPILKTSIETYAKAGITYVLHADANWLPMLPYFTQLPKGCCHIELDGATDIVKAYDILQGSQSIRGDVPSTLLAYKDPSDVAEYCEKLVQMGMKGGFMLGSGCEVPLNAKPENVKAMIDVLRG